MTLGRGMRNDWTPSTRQRQLPGDEDDRRRRSTRGQPLPGDDRVTAGRAAHARPSARTRSASRSRRRRPSAGSSWRRASRTRVTSSEVALGLARLDRPLGGQVDVDDLRDPARPRGHDDDPRRQEDRLGDAVGHEHDGRPGPSPDAHQLGVHPLAGHLVEGAERLVHEQQLRIERQRPGDRDALLHAARQLPRMPLGERLELDEAEQVGGPAAALVGRVAHDLERQLDVLGDRPPVHQDRAPGRPSRSRGPAGPAPAGLPLIVDRAAGRLGQVADEPQQGRLAAAGRTDERDELALADRQVDRFERRHRGVARAEDLADPGRLDDGRRRRRRRCGVLGRAVTASPPPVGSGRASGAARRG